MRHPLMALGLSALMSAWPCAALAQELKVGISSQLGWVDVTHNGQRVRIQRIQDTSHRLDDAWARTSRPCPPSCIQPMQSAAGVQTVGEVELVGFLAGRARAGAGLVIDARPPADYHAETIPGAVNIPFSIIRPDNPHLAEVLRALGAQHRGGRWDFAAARDLLLFCAGAWSDRSARAIQALVAIGYPAEKLMYYRGGLQSWRSLGLTTVLADAPR